MAPYRQDADSASGVCGAGRGGKVGAARVVPVSRSSVVAKQPHGASRRPLRCGAVMAPAGPPGLEDVTLSGLNGKALLVTEWPSKVRTRVPWRSMAGRGAPNRGSSHAPSLGGC